MIDNSTPKDGLSPKARALADQLGHTGSIAEALKNDPSLAEGLDEYQKWRDKEHQAEGERIGKDTKLHPMNHGIAETLKKLGPPERRKGKK